MKHAVPKLDEKTTPTMMAIDPDAAPRMTKGTAFLYQSAYVTQHFFGKDRLKTFREKQERKIEEQSQAFGEKGDLPLPRMHVDDLKPGMFRKLYQNPNTPVVIEGFGADWEAVKTWTPEFFSERYGDSRIPVRIKGASAKADKLHVEEMPLRDLIENILNGGEYYGNNLEDIFNENPELRSHMDLSQVEKLTMKAKDYEKKRRKGLRIPCEGEIVSTQFFFSNGNGRTGYHCSTGGNLFVQIHGIKEWTFVSPRHSAWMHPEIRRDMLYAQSEIDQAKSQTELDAEGFPLYRYIPRYRGDLRPGDVLLSPQWWWHAVDNRENSIGVSLRYRVPQFRGNGLYALLNLLSPSMLRHFLTIFKTGWGSDRTAVKQIFDMAK